MNTPTTEPPATPTAADLINQLSGDAIARRLDQIDAERAALVALLRGIGRAERALMRAAEKAEVAS